MFDEKFTAEIVGVKVKVAEDGAQVQRCCRVVLESDLDGSLADGIGGDAGVDALQNLRDRTISKIVFPIDAITARASLSGLAGTTILLDEVTGIRATAVAPTVKEGKDPEPPKVRVELQFPFSERAWLFLGRNCAAFVDVVLSKGQLDLGLVTAPAAKSGAKKQTPKERAEEIAAAAAVDDPKPAPLLKKPRRAKPKVLSRSCFLHGDHEEIDCPKCSAERIARVSEDLDEVQIEAETPEQAEEIRAKRAREGLEHAGVDPENLDEDDDEDRDQEKAAASTVERLAF